jgi:ABC-type transport system involved in cytochrome bd biosynthesis fused ATPase/permease subunit
MISGDFQSDPKLVKAFGEGLEAKKAGEECSPPYPYPSESEPRRAWVAGYLSIAIDSKEIPREARKKLWKQVKANAKANDKNQPIVPLKTALVLFLLASLLTYLASFGMPSAIPLWYYAAAVPIMTVILYILFVIAAVALVIILRMLPLIIVGFFIGIGVMLAMWLL